MIPKVREWLDTQAGRGIGAASGVVQAVGSHVQNFLRSARNDNARVVVVRFPLLIHTTDAAGAKMLGIFAATFVAQ